MTDEAIRAQFPALSRVQNGRQLVYLDSAATAQRPQAVLDAEEAYYRLHNANPHRGVYTLAVEATEAYEEARAKVAAFLNAKPEEIIFTRNATESLNLAAYCYGFANLKKGDRVVISILEHHSNLIPWQQICRLTGAELTYLYCDPDGVIPEEEIAAKITPGVKIVSMTQVSNVLGVVMPVREVFGRAHAVGAVTVMDAAQSAPHMTIDVQTLGADFIAFSGHKMFAPYGIGVLWGRRDLLEAMPPFLTGGEMIDAVREQDATWAPLPQKFEAGTQNSGAAVALGAAIDWMQAVGRDEIARREEEVYRYAWERLTHLEHITVYGRNSLPHLGAIAFNVDDVHPHDVATILDDDAVAIRVGHHCAQPLLKHLGLNACCRVSVSVYNTKEEIDRLCESLLKVRKWLGFGA